MKGKTINTHIIDQMAAQPTYKEGLSVGLQLCREFYSWDKDQCGKYTSCSWDVNRSSGYRKLYKALKMNRVHGIPRKLSKVTATVTAESVEQLQLLVEHMSNSGEQSDCFVEENIRFEYDYKTGDIEISRYKE